MKLTGAEIVIEVLKEQQVDTIFGYPGGAMLNIYDALYKHQDEIRHYRTSHEQGASHAADGYARATGKVGVCFATSGPGATNLVTGIATAYMDSVPMVAITANVPTNMLGKDSFQEVDITGITMPITKHNYIVKKVEDLADTIRDAFYIAKSGRPGPVLIDIPKDITSNVCEYEKKEPRKIERQTKFLKEEDIQEAIELIKKSKRPFIYAGGGCITSEASEELEEFADKIGAPVSLSLMGLGGLPSKDEKYTGMLGMHGSKVSNLLTTKTDLLIAIGARFSDRVISDKERFAKDAKVLHIDIDQAEIGKNIKAYHKVIGDVKEVLGVLNKRFKKRELKDWEEEVKHLKQQYPFGYKEEGLMPGYILERLNEITREKEVIYTTEVGQNQIWAAQYLNHKKPRTFLSSGGLGTMGFGLGAAIGAKAAYPKKIVIDIAGDGSFRMNCNELLTSVENDLPVIVLLFNNHALGMVRQWQNLFYEKRFSHTTVKKGVDIVKLAQGFGAIGMNMTKKEEVDKILKEAIYLNKTVVINCEIGSDVNVYPIVAPGDAIDSQIME